MASSTGLVYTCEMNIIFFDGHCGLCDRLVTEIFLRDRTHRFKFAPLQGPTARQRLKEPPSLNTIVFLKQDRTFVKSNAVLEIFRELGGFYSLIGLFKIVPLFLRDALYDLIARHRYGWFGESPTCRLPTESEKPYFLD
jgi:predicted DCC family thiol-disulfide oxidoreductase YuxK